jgi:amino acid permease
MMTRMLSLALLAGGVVLIIFGISAADSFNSQVSEFFTGSPTDRAIWMLVIGIVLAIAGLGGTVFGGSRKGA